MAGLLFEASADKAKVHLHLFDLEEDCLSVEYLKKQFNLTEFRQYWLSEEALGKALDQYKKKLSGNTSKPPAKPEATEPAESPDDDLDVVSLIVAEQRPAEISFEISDDKMSCKLRVITAYGCSNPSPEQINALLKENGILQGVDYPKIQSLCKNFENVEPGTKFKEVIAEGKSPGESTAANLDFLVQPIQDRLTQPTLRDDGTVDMYDFGEIQMVEVNDPLVKRTPPVVGEPGYNVLGQAVEAERPQDVKIQAGDGTALSSTDENLLIATRRGVPMREANGMLVEDAYCVPNVDLKTGNIDFDGSVVVKGSVNEGMKVKATGKVIVQEFVEASEIEAGGDVVIGKGVLGRQAKRGENVNYSAIVRCGGDFSANYVQNALIDAAGDVNVTKHVMHSQIRGKAITVLSLKKGEGKVLGGCIQPNEKLECTILGATSYIQTLVTFEHLFSEILHDIAVIDKEVAERIQVIVGMEEALNGIPRNTDKPELKAQAKKIVNTIRHFKNLIAERRTEKKLMVQCMREKKEQLEVIVQRNLYPGVEVAFVNRSIPVKQEKASCKIKAKEEGITYYMLT